MLVLVLEQGISVVCVYEQGSVSEGIEILLNPWPEEVAVYAVGCLIYAKNISVADGGDVQLGSGIGAFFRIVLEIRLVLKPYPWILPEDHSVAIRLSQI